MKKRIFALLLSVILVLPMLATGVSAADTEYVSASKLVNLYNSNTDFDGYIDATGKEIADDDINTSAHISVKEGDVVTFGPCDPKKDFLVAGFDENKNVKDAVSSNKSLTLVDDFGRYVIYSYTVPAGVTTVRVMDKAEVNNSNPAVNDIFTVTVNQVFSCAVFEEYWTARSASFRRLHGNVIEKKTTSVLYQKSVLFCGDSISYGTQDYSLYAPGSWGGRIGYANDMEYVNASVSGASVSTTRSNRIINQLKSNVFTDFEFVILHGGVNDAWDSISVGATNSNDIATFSGALAELFQTAKRLWPEAKIGYIINFEAPKCTNGKVSDMSAYVNAAKKICEEFEIPYLNLYEDTDLCQNKLQVTTKNCLADYIHPNAAGYDLLYPIIEAWMEEISGLKPAETTAPEEETTIEPEQTESNEETTTADNGTETDQPDDGESGCSSTLGTPIACLIGGVGILAAVFPRKKRE